MASTAKTKEQKQYEKEQLQFLNEQREQLRSDVQDMELRARHWKATWEIKHYTLEGEKLQPDYEKWIHMNNEREVARKAKQQADFEEQLRLAQQGEPTGNPDADVQVSVEPDTLDDSQG